MRLLLFLIVFFSGSIGFGQSSPIKLDSSWYGLWEGQLEIWSMGHKVQELPMSLEIQPNQENYNFILVYKMNPDEPDIRPYELKPVNDSIGHYVIDEHNSILLDSYLIDNCLLDLFSMESSGVYSRICNHSEYIDLEMLGLGLEPIRTSGGEVIQQDTMPEVKSYPLRSMTKAKLYRK